MANDIRLCFNRRTLEEVIIPEEDRFLNMLILGPTGTGKSAHIMTPLIYQDLMSSECGITLIDPKEDLAEHIYEIATEFKERNVIYVDPLDQYCPKINPLKGDMETVTKNMLKIFSPTFIVGSSSEKQNIDINRILIIKSIKLLKSFPSLCGNDLNFKTYSDFISNKHNEGRMKVAKLLDNLKVQKSNTDNLDLCEWFLHQYFEPSTGLFEKCSYIRFKVEEMVSNKYLLNILTPSPNEKKIINFDEHLAFGDVVIINTRNTILGYLGKVFGEFLMLEYLNSVFKRKHYCAKNNIPTLKPNFLYIDEFATYSPVLTDLFVQGRSFRIGTHIAVQNRTLLKICGEEDTRNQAFIIESNTRNLVLFPGLNGEDADYYSKQFFNLHPSEIMYRPFGQIVYRIVQNRNIIPPDIGLTFFVDEKPNANSIRNEYSFTEDGRIIYKEKQIIE